MEHVARATVRSPYVSLTRSCGVARHYALYFGRDQPTADQPAYVYEVEINNPPPAGLELLDPVKEVAREAQSPLDLLSYHHDGSPEFLLGGGRPAKDGRVPGGALSSTGAGEGYQETPQPFDPA